MKECLDKKKTEYENEKTKIFQIFFSVLGFELSLLRFLWGLPPKSVSTPFFPPPPPEQLGLQSWMTMLNVFLSVHARFNMWKLTKKFQTIYLVYYSDWKFKLLNCKDTENA